MLSVRRATSAETVPASYHPDFYPRPPRGGRLSVTAWLLLLAINFYPRPPRGGRPDSSQLSMMSTVISIHALREEGDGPVHVGDLSDIEISIHALREEGDAIRPARNP